MSIIDWESALSEYIPSHMHGAVARYIESGLPPGHFLESVLTNDLKGAVFSADPTNIHRIPSYVHFFAWYCPSVCWGSPDAYWAWIKRGGLNGKKETETENERDSDEDDPYENGSNGC